MEAIAAFSLACNVVQVVDFGLKVANTLKEISKTGSAVRVQDFQNTSIQFKLSTENLAKSINGARPLTKDDSDLVELSRKSFDTAQALESKLNDVAYSGKRERGVFGKAVKTFRNDRAVQELYRRLSEYRSVLDTRLLVRLSQQHDAAAVIQHEEFAILDTTLQAFIIRLSDGLTHVSELILTEHSKIRELSVAHHAATGRLIQDSATRITSANVCDHSITRAAIEAQGNKTIDSVSTNISQWKKEQDTAKERQRLLDSLYFPEINLRRDDIVDVHRKTFKWIFAETGDEHDGDSESEDDNKGFANAGNSSINKSSIQPWDNFAQWLMDSARLYWINGKAGSGKSTLMNYICNHEHTKALLSQWRQQPILLPFYFWRAGARLQKSIEGLFRSLLYQLLTSDKALYERLIQLNPRLLQSEASGASEISWSQRSLGRLFEIAIKSSHQPLCIFLDGLDEFEEEEIGFSIEELVNLVRTLGENQHVKLCVSSRPSEYLKESFAGLPQLRLQDLTRGDMRRYIMDRVSNDLALTQIRGRPDNYQSEIVDALLDRAEGVFLWVALAVKSLLSGLRNKDTWALLMSRLDQLPPTLKRLYAHMWARMNEDEPIYEKEATELLRMALFDVRHEFPRTCTSLWSFTVRRMPENYRDNLARLKDRAFQQIAGDCEYLRSRISILSAGLLEVRDDSPDEDDEDDENEDEDDEYEDDEHEDDENEDVEHDDGNRLVIFQKHYRFRGSGNQSSAITASSIGANSRREDWELWKLYRCTRITFIHRSAVDFLNGSVAGKHIVENDDSTNAGLCTRLLGTWLLAFALGLERCSNQNFLRIFHMVDLFLEQSTSSDRSEVEDFDLPCLLNFYYSKISEGDFRSASLDMDQAIAQRPVSLEWSGLSHLNPKDFLGWVIRDFKHASSSRWVIAHLSRSSRSYTSYLLSCASVSQIPHSTSCANSNLLLAHGADPNSQPNFVLGKGVSCWHQFVVSIAQSLPNDYCFNHYGDLDGLVDTFRGDLDRLVDTFHSFLKHGASREELILLIHWHNTRPPWLWPFHCPSLPARDKICFTFEAGMLLDSFLESRCNSSLTIPVKGVKAVLHRPNGTWLRSANDSLANRLLSCKRRDGSRDVCFEDGLEDVKLRLHEEGFEITEDEAFSYLRLDRPESKAYREWIANNLTPVRREGLRSRDVAPLYFLPSKFWYSFYNSDKPNNGV